MRWVQRYVPEFTKQWQRYARSVGSSWRVDETCIKIKGTWAYLYRSVDKEGYTVDFLLSEHRDIAAATRFFSQAVAKYGAPHKITLDGYTASHAAVAELQAENILPFTLTVRTNRYLNNLIEQDHRRVKQRVKPMLGFKRFDHAALTLSGIELVHQIQKAQFDVSALCSSQVRSPQVWQAVLVD
jgi:transposase-like protein